MTPNHGCRDCTVTLAIHPGDRDFRVASEVRGVSVLWRNSAAFLTEDASAAILLASERGETRPGAV
jgi:hypothetical protein